ncbi:MAG: glycosyltransferase family 2 protein [Methylophaga sp.]|uniref:glycosyltransferase family 2 protein n=1 Tax=Methylophaga sp. TaxID=2024840 RepID=UPI000C0D2700|nr:glycosyltransferase family 2 protein [Methylophaga sp.]MBL1457684.1 glycosyltransferase family 2 protein [Methylophaga sp.]
MKIGVVTVNYKSAELTKKNIHSLITLDTAHELHIVVVDNDSLDNSVSVISDYIKENNLFDKVEIIASDINGGFAYGCNLGISYHLNKTQPDFYWLLNPDAAALEGSVDELVSALQQNPKVGIAGSRLENTDGSPRNAAFDFHTWKTELSRGFGLAFLDRFFVGNTKTPSDISSTLLYSDWVSGASMMIKRQVVEEIGLMDEQYFLYFEEMDYCLKAYSYGWQCIHVPASRVLHVAGSSSGVNAVNQPEKRRPDYWFDSRRRFFIKNYGRLHALVADFFWLVGFTTWRLRNCIQKKQHKYPPYFLIDSFRNSVFIKGFKID